MSSLHVSLTILQLQVLDSLLGGRSVTQTGDELGLTQSAISHTLRLLRRHFADELLVRRGRGTSWSHRRATWTVAGDRKVPDS